MQFLNDRSNVIDQLDNIGTFNASWTFVEELRNNTYKIREFTNYLHFEKEVEKGV